VYNPSFWMIKNPGLPLLFGEKKPVANCFRASFLPK